MAPRLFIVFALISGAAAADSFTNHAGHVVCGCLEAVSNNVAVISGRAYPLSIFPDSEKKRIQDAFGGLPRLPPRLVAMRSSLRDRYLRNEALFKAGAKSAEQAARQRSRLVGIWRRALDEDGELDQAQRDAWAAHLLD